MQGRTEPRELKAHPQADTDDITVLEWSVPQKAKQRRKNAAKGETKERINTPTCIRIHVYV